MEPSHRASERTIRPLEFVAFVLVGLPFMSGGGVEAVTTREAMWQTGTRVLMGDPPERVVDNDDVDMRPDEEG